MLVPYYEINRGGCLICCYSPYVFEAESTRISRMPDKVEITKYVYNTDTQFVDVLVWEECLNDWMTVGGAPLVKMGASLVKSIEFAHATARLHDYWL